MPSTSATSPMAASGCMCRSSSCKPRKYQAALAGLGELIGLAMLAQRRGTEHGEDDHPGDHQQGGRAFALHQVRDGGQARARMLASLRRAAGRCRRSCALSRSGSSEMDASSRG